MAIAIAMPVPMQTRAPAHQAPAHFMIARYYVARHPSSRGAANISPVLGVGARLILIAVAAANPIPPIPPAAPAPPAPLTPPTRATPPTPSAPAATLPIGSGRTTTVIARIDVGAPIERTVPSASYLRAATADAEERWADAQPFYRQAIADWTATTRTRPSRVLELAIAKAERELRSSQLLAGAAAQDARIPVGRNRMMSAEVQRNWERRQALDEGRLLSAKLLATRATLGRVPAALYVHARNRLEEARDTEPHPPDRAATDAQADVELLLCATYAAGGAAADARFARAHVTEAERADPANTLGVAACAAGLGETEAALAGLETFVLRPVPARPERFLREIYLSNDWDRLRGNPRFESLFPR
jgi:hypothetical protein